MLNDFDSPMPLWVVDNGDSEITNGNTELMMVDELIIDVPYLKPNSRFGISPFTINLTHKDAPLHQ